MPASVVRMCFSPMFTEDCVQREIAKELNEESTEVAEFFMKTRMIESEVVVNHKPRKTSKVGPNLALFVMESGQSIFSQSDALSLQNVVISETWQFLDPIQD